MHKKIPSIFTFISEFKKEQILKFNENIGIIFRNYEDKFNKNQIIELKQLVIMFLMMHLVEKEH